MDDVVICPTCGKSFSKKGIGTHIWRMHGAGTDFDPNRGYQDGTRQAWNKGLTKDTNESVKKYANSLMREKSPLEQKLDDDGKLIQKWRNKCVNAKAEGIDCNLTFDEYCQLVDEAGLTSSQLGFTGEGYVLGRVNDEGNYETGNCRFITQKENSDEKLTRLYPDKYPGVG